MTDSKPAGHYTLVVDITHSTPEYQVTNRSGYPEGKAVPREVREVTKIVLRDADLNNLIDRAKNHIDLTEDNA